MSKILNDKQLDIPKEVEFENFTLDFFREFWKDPKANLNGVKGSTQHGVDIYGWPDAKEGFYGVQCKWKDRSKGVKLTANKTSQNDDIYSQIEKAKKFTPALKEFLIVTTATRDVEIQKIEREINAEHKANGLFGLQIIFWDDFVGYIPDMPITREKWYPFHFGATNIRPRLSESQVIKNENTQLLEGNICNSAQINIQGSNNVVITQLNSDDDNVHHAKVDTAKKFLESFNPDKAIEELESLKKDIWNKCEDVIKFRILTNLGVAYSQTGHPEKAALLFIEALQYNSNDEKALLNSAAGYLLLNNNEEALNKIGEALKQNPQNGRAYSLKIQAQDDDNSIENIISLVPSNLLRNQDVAFAISRFAKIKYNLEEAEKWLIIALEEDQKNEDTQSALAEVLLQQVLDDHMVIFAGHIDDKNKIKLDKAIKLFSEAWNKIERSELAKYRTSWLVNRSFAKGLIDKEGASEDIELALKVNPENPNAIRSKAGILFDSGNIEGAIKWLESNKVILETDPSLSFMLAGILRKTGNTNKAIEVINNLLKKPNGETKNHDAKRLLIQLYLDQKNYPKAKETLAIIPTAPEFVILNLLEKSRIKSAEGLEVESIADLVEAKKKCDTLTPKNQKLELANAFYSFQQFSDSADLFQDLIDDVGDDDITKKYINSLYRDGRYAKALEIAESLKNKIGLNKYIVELEFSIYEEMGDLKESEKICADYLKENSENKEIRIRLAVAKLRIGRNTQEIMEILKPVSNINDLSFEYASQLSRLYKDIGENFKSIDLAYEIRRNFHSNPESHLYYIGMFLEREKENQPYFDKNVIGLDTVVKTRNSMGAEDTFTLEDRQGSDIRLHEINKENDLFKKLIGKKVGDKIEINPISKESIEVVEVKSKYVYAFQEVFSKFNTIFPNAPGLVGFTFDSSTPEKESQSVQQMLDQISVANKQISSVEEFYKNGKLTIGAFANFLNKNPIEIFGGLMASKTTKLRVAVGSVDELESSVSYLRSFNSPKILTDITGLISISGIKLGDKLVQKYGKIALTQSTIDLITQIIFERKGVASKGYMSISKEGEKFVKEEFSSEQIASSLVYFENMQEWVSKNCEVIPIPLDILIKIDERKDLENLLGKSFADTLIVASQKKHVYYTDDERLRSYAKNEHGFDAIWTQLILMELLHENFITDTEYNTSVCKLVNANYFYTMINNRIIYHAGKEVGWDVSNPAFTKVLNLLSEDNTDYLSGGSVAVEFLYLLWRDESVLLEDRKKVTLYIISILTLKRERKIEIIANFKKLVEKHFFSNVRAREEIIAIIDDLL